MFSFSYGENPLMLAYIRGPSVSMHYTEYKGDYGTARRNPKRDRTGMAIKLSTWLLTDIG